MQEQVNILAIETSCDETAAAVVQNGREVLAEQLYSQADIHREYGGVVPEIASRSHVEKLPHIVPAAIDGAGGKEQIDAVAVTYGPGLVGALLTGVSYAKALAYAWGKPLVPVNHIAGHICANYISHKELKPPFICLVISGGHTQIVKTLDYTSYETLGQTRDDAAGEAIDKVARVLGLPYPGGPNLQQLALAGDSARYEMPRVFKGESHLDFSFSGLKTAVINMLHRMDQAGEAYKKEDVAASFLKAVADTLANNTFEAARRQGMDVLAVAGGVSANTQVRQAFEARAAKEGIKLYFPEMKYCTDNAAMIASAGYYAYMDGRRGDMTLNAKPVLELL
ncbi:tRNA (adenosine(37)-N6)-threonylcarbamoyltransferase complex transferase subunit TsaD [Christensenellaceae bacterium OttesenSCG-928-K19]|nr:tRNA (adenosine(37)-N6)-threonylcarbamoyltransferase complex transferase subunit TsaD [Christensenellaceae bacterium OttesenSCG-928-K19]